MTEPVIRTGLGPATTSSQPALPPTHELEGRWARLASGRLVRILGVDGDVVIAETPGGQTVDRPVAHVLASWTLLADNSLSVRALTERDATRAAVKSSPIDIVVWALVDLGGEAETANLKALIEAAVGEWTGQGDNFKAWWRKVQPRLGDDPRIDDSRSLERRYRLLGPGERKRDVVMPRISEQWRLGRRLAFAPALKSARERVRDSKRPLLDDERADMTAEAALSELDDLDPTDRFMAAELGVWLGLYTQVEATELLGEDLLSLDLARVPQKASRTEALRLLSTWLDSHVEDWSWSGPAAPVTLGTALALGIDWSSVLEPIARRIGVSRSAVVERAISWGYPGSEESQPVKLPGDYEPYQKRLAQFRELLPSAEPSVLAGIERGALVALGGLAKSEKHKGRSEEAVADTATLATRARLAMAGLSAAPAEMIAALPPERLEALMRPKGLAPGRWASTYLDAVELAVATAPWAYRGPLELVSTLTDEDAAAIALRVARRAARNSQVAQIARMGVTVSADPVARSWCVALAGTADPEDLSVRSMLQSEAGRVAGDRLPSEEYVSQPGQVSGLDWSRLMEGLAGQIVTAHRERDGALREVRDAEARMVELRAAAEQARDALATSRAAGHSVTQTYSAKQRAHLLKPVAAALADSLEAPSLEALQDRLAAVLDRASIVPIIEPGHVNPFDPELHRWVGDEPYPTAAVRAVSPGFIAKLEGEDDIVLVPARVVAAQNDG